MRINDLDLVVTVTSSVSIVIAAAGGLLGDPTDFSGGFIPSVHSTFPTSRCAPAARGCANIPIPHTMLCSLKTALRRVLNFYCSWHLPCDLVPPTNMAPRAAAWFAHA